MHINTHIPLIMHVHLGSLDREIQSTHTFRVQATEEPDGRSSIAQMRITVQDENDNTPTFERLYFNLTVEEDEEVRSARGKRVQESRERGKVHVLWWRKGIWGFP